MENETNNQNTNLNATLTMTAKNDPLRKVAKITLVVFIASITLLALFGIIDVWGGFSNDSNDIFAKLEGTLGILTGASFFLSIGLRIFTGKKK
jgi:hypothetical protein